MYGSRWANPNQHNHKRVPFFLCGHAGGAVQGRRSPAGAERHAAGERDAGLAARARPRRPRSSSATATPCSTRLMIQDLRHALRAIARMPVLATVIVLSLGVGIGVNTAVFSWIQAVVLQPLPGVDGQRRPPSRRAEGRHRHLSRRVVARIRRPARSMRSVEPMLAFRMVPLQRRRAGPYRAGLRAAGVRQLLHGARADAGARPVHPARRSRRAGRRAGRGRVARLLADASRRHSRRRRPDAFASTTTR